MDLMYPGHQGGASGPLGKDQIWCNCYLIFSSRTMHCPFPGLSLDPTFSPSEKPLPGLSISHFPSSSVSAIPSLRVEIVVFGLPGILLPS